MSEALALFRGAAAAGSAGTVIFAGLVLFGVVEDPAAGIFLAGAGLAAVFGLSPQDRKRLGWLGAVAAGALALVSGLVTGFGWIENSAVAGSVLTAAWMGMGEWRPPSPEGWFRWGWPVALLLAVVILPLILEGGTLGHDEAAYALKSRQWLEGTPGSGWWIHRGVGMSVYGYVVLGLGGSEAGLRLLGLVALMALSAGAWALGRRMHDAATGAMASVAVVAGPAILRRSTEYLSDIPSAALLTFTMVILWRELKERDQPSYRLLWALPTAWAAFYLRYQSSISLVLITLTAVALWWPKLRKRPGPVLGLVGVGLLGLIPHFILSIDLTGTPWGIVKGTSDQVGTRLGEGLGHYWDLLGWALAGWVGPVALVMGLAGAVFWWKSRETRDRYVFLLAPALLQVLVLGLVAHGEPRFLFFPIALTVVAGAMTVRRLVDEAEKPWAGAGALALGMIVIGSLALSVPQARIYVSNREENNEAVKLVATELASRTGDVSCGVITSYSPQVTYYSGCLTDIFWTGLEPVDALARLPTEARFLVLMDNGKRQPTGEGLDALLALTDGSPVVVSGEGRSGTVYRFEE
jgi:hypothetical protein